MIRTLLALLPIDRRGLLVGQLALVVLSVLLRAAGALLLIPLVAALFSSDPGVDGPRSALPWLGWLTVVTVAGWVVDAIAARLGFEAGFTILDHAQHDLTDRLTRIRLTWFSAENTSTARQAIASTGPDLVGLVTYLLTPLLSAILLPVAIAVGLLLISWHLGVAALLGVVVLLGALALSARITRQADRAADRANASLTERIVEFARTQQALRAARRVSTARSHAGAALTAQHSAVLKLILMQAPGQLLFSVASQLALVLLAGTTAWLTIGGELAPAEAVAMIVVMVRYLEPIVMQGELAPAIEPIRATLERIRTVLEAPVTDSGNRDLAIGPITIGTAPRVELRDLSFHWDSGDVAPALDRINLTLEPGSTTAVVGPSGSGKSTLLAILAGLQTPTAGQLLLDGVDACELTEPARRACASMVFQHPYLFTGSITDNIRAGHPEADAAAVAQASSLARVDEITDRLPDGGDTAVGEGGTALSGGERQRVSIARALVKPAPLLLIDEATSALDTENETAVVQALSSDPRPRTRVIVAHRLASIAHADRVLFLAEGRIVEDGTIAELIAAGGRFAEYAAHQRASTGWQVRASERA